MFIYFNFFLGQPCYAQAHGFESLWEAKFDRCGQTNDAQRWVGLSLTQEQKCKTVGGERKVSVNIMSITVFDKESHVTTCRS